MTGAPLDTAAFYAASCAAGFVKTESIARNLGWTTPTRWGELQITVNLAKPEKDPRAIARGEGEGAGAFTDPATGRQRPCPLCVCDEDFACGYARPLQLGGEPWGMWYSPYAYYPEHCIAMSRVHRPMHVDRAALACLLDFCDAVPGYFIGSNADLPIVGGSILGHDHFQGGRHVFPMQLAPDEERFGLPGAPDVQAATVRWPVSTVRLRAADRDQLTSAACRVMGAWAAHSDARAGIVAYGGFERHNTVTPILRRRGDAYELDLALRCNVTTPDRPLGLFHPPERLWRVKKENIGLIEVMGLAILPPRVAGAFPLRADGPGAVPDAVQAARDEVGGLFAEVLESTGVFKWDAEGRAAQGRFLDYVTSAVR